MYIGKFSGIFIYFRKRIKFKYFRIIIYNFLVIFLYLIILIFIYLLIIKNLGVVL